MDTRPSPTESSSPVGALALASLLLLAACGQPLDRAIEVTCSEIAPAAASGAPAPAPGDSALAPPLAVTPDDTLDLFVTLDSVPPGPGSVRIRVDGLAEPGLVKFFMPPPTAAAAGMALQPPATFGGCAAVAPAGLGLHAPWAPRAKAWVRVSTDRPVRVQPRIPGRRADPVIVMPKASAIVGWEG